MAELTLEEARPRLRKAYREQRLIPFIGAGFSAPLKLPGWGTLMQWMAEPLGFEPDLFTLHGSHLQLAGYYALKKKGGLKSFIDRMRKNFHTPEVEKRRATSIQHQALAKLRFRRIYTTNFEHHIEEALRAERRKVQVLARLQDFMQPVEPDTCQVVKFHGDLDYPETVVLTENQFFDRFRLEAAPDQRLRADLLGNAFLFLGYSFNDPNLRYIWYRMNCLRRATLPAGGNGAPALRSYLVNFGTGLIQPSLLEDWDVDVIVLDPRDKERSVARLLNAIDPGRRP